MRRAPALTPAPALCCAQFAQEAASKVTSMAKASTTSDQTRMGMMFAETDDELAYLVFVAPDYPERVAKQLVDKHARAVESMASDGARTRATCHTLPARATPSRPVPHPPGPGPRRQHSSMRIGCPTPPRGPPPGLS